MAGSPARLAGRSDRYLVLVAVVVLGLGFVLHAGPWIGRGFGYSHDGFNGAVWGQGARALADDPIGSRLGGIQPDGHPYANHPPLTVWSSGALTAVAGDHPLVVRAPAVLGSLAAIGLLALVLAEAGASRWAVVAGVAASATTPMFLTYGAMLDTPVVSLPCGLAALLVAQRVWSGRPPPAVAIVAIGALAATSGWQAVAVATLAGASCLVAGRAARRGGLLLMSGVAGGVAITGGWVLFVHGSLRPLLDQAGVRSGGAETGMRWTTMMGQYLADLYRPGLVLLVAAGIVVAVVAGRGGGGGSASRWAVEGLRPVALVLTLTVVGYTVAFRNGSSVHDYWTYWGVALVGVAVAALSDALLDRVRSGGMARTGATVVVVVAVAALAVSNLTYQSTAERRITRGLDLLPMFDPVPRPDDPTESTLAVYGSPGTVPWADYATHGRVERADTPDALRRLPPDRLVLVVLRRPPTAQLRAIALRARGHFALVRAAELAEHLDG